MNDPERIVELVDLANSKLAISSDDKPRNGDNNGHNDNEITCSKCQSTNPMISRYCNNCGSNLTSTCSKCGHNNPMGSEFCNKRGLALA